MNPWYRSPQTWNAYGLTWEFTYSELNAKRTITATGFTLDVPIVDTSKFPSPQAWLGAWAKRNKKRLPKMELNAFTPELDFSGASTSSSPSTQKSDEQADQTVQVEVVVDELTEEEERVRQILERQVERAFYSAGRALRELRSRRLYRSTHKTFEEYCRDRFGFTRDSAYLKIRAADVYENLEQNLPTNGRHLPLPTNERQLRHLAKAKLEPAVQAEVWQQAVSSAGGKVPSGRIVKDIVQRIRERTPVPNPYRVGEVCQLIALDNPELRGKGGCWCIVSEIHSFGCTVTTWDGSYTVRLEHLKSLDYSEKECQKMREISARLTRLHETGNLDAAAYWILNGLGKMPKPYLTPTEEKLLSVLESEYGLKPKPESANEQGMRPDSSHSEEVRASFSSPASSQKVEVNTNDICVAFMSNLGSLSTAHIKAVGKAIAVRAPHLAELMASACAQSEAQAVAIVKALTLIYPEAIRDLIEEINNNKNSLVNDGNPENGDVG